MSELYFRVYGVGGADLDTVIKDMVELSNRLEIKIMCNFNGSEIYCTPGDDYERVYDFYQVSYKSNKIK